MELVGISTSGRFRRFPRSMVRFSKGSQILATETTEDPEKDNVLLNVSLCAPQYSPPLIPSGRPWFHLAVKSFFGNSLQELFKGKGWFNGWVHFLASELASLIRPFNELIEIFYVHLRDFSPIFFRIVGKLRRVFSSSHSPLTTHEGKSYAAPCSSP